MKLHALGLALAIFTGSLASVHSDQQNSLFAQLQQDIKGYMETVSSAIERGYFWATSTNTSRELSAQGEEDYAKAEQYLRGIYKELPADVQRSVDVVTHVSRATADAVGDTAISIFGNMGTPLMELDRALDEVIAHYADPILEKARGQVEALSAKIQELSAKKEETLALQLEELKTWEARLAPRVRALRTQWQEFQKSLKPLAEWLRDSVWKSAEALNKKTYLASILEMLDKRDKE